MVRRTLAMTMALALFGPGLALAEEEDPARTGPYIGVGLVLGVENFESQVQNEVQDNLEARPSCTQFVTTGCVNRPLGPAHVDLKDTGGLDAHIGWRMHRFLAVEAEVEWMAFLGWDSDEGFIDGGTRSRELKVDVDTLVITGNLKPYFLTGRIQPFGLVGAGIMYSELDVKYDGDNQPERDNGFVMRFGGGVDFYASSNFVLSLQGSYVLPSGGVKDRDYFSIGMLGLTYRF